MKHFRLQTHVTSLGLTSLVPVTKAYILNKAHDLDITEMPMYLAKQHAEKGGMFSSHINCSGQCNCHNWTCVWTV